MKRLRLFRQRISALASFALLLAGLRTHAQQSAPLTQLAFHPYVANPAFAGINKQLELTAHARVQWLGISGSPLIQYLSAHTPLAFGKAGTGLLVHHSLTGAFRLTSASFSYAHQLRLGASLFAAGLAAGLTQASLQGQNLRAPQGNYSAGIDHQDPILPVNVVGGTAFDLTAGLSWVHPRMRAGLSATNLLQAPLKLQAEQVAQYRPLVQYVAFLDVNVRLSNSLAMEPFVVARMSASKPQFEGGLTFKHRNLLWAGIGMRGFNEFTADAVMAWIGLQTTPRLRVGYSYDYTMTALREVSQGTHEVLVSYSLSLLRAATKGKTIYNTRF
ncbi:MAG: PorP/SprF family type IX secretion system membrane protein [Chitinophagales bacterium]|nr:PorP/SprF family type IX secretion system membrane protein [Chitinophagales bacterium]MDW8426970.1 PorP/SprF family type IX secretion system membrane protein [Chitinophagales bacterium]